VGYSCEQRWFNLFVDIQAQQDAPTQDKFKSKIKQAQKDRVDRKSSTILNRVSSGVNIPKIGYKNIHVKNLLVIVF
jgi:hypothetical protein